MNPTELEKQLTRIRNHTIFDSETYAALKLHADEMVTKITICDDTALIRIERKYGRESARGRRVIMVEDDGTAWTLVGEPTWTPFYDVPAAPCRVMVRETALTHEKPVTWEVWSRASVGLPAVLVATMHDETLAFLTAKDYGYDVVRVQGISREKQDIS